MKFSRVALVLLLSALSAARAAVVETAAPEVYPAASRAWTSAIGSALTPAPGAPALAPDLLALAAPSVEPSRALAPVAAQLQGALGITPAAFAALPAPEKRAALDLAADAARDELRQTAAELDARSRALCAPGHALDRDGRAQLYDTVAKLSELRASYGPLLDPETNAQVERSYERAVQRAVKARDELIGARAGALAAQLTSGPPAAGEPAADPLSLPGASATALKLYARMSESPAGWGADDIDALLTGFGFQRRDGKHRNYSHPRFPSLHDSYSHQRQLKEVYVKSALRMVRELARLSAPGAPSPAKAPANFDASRIRLEDLAVLLAPPKAKPSATRSEKPAPKRASPAPSAPSTPSPVATLSPSVAGTRRQPRQEPPPAPTPTPAPEPSRPDSVLSRAAARLRALLGLGQD